MSTTKIYQVTMPKWLRVLDVDNPVITNAMDGIKRFTAKPKKGAEMMNVEKVFESSPFFKSLQQTSIDEERGISSYEIVPHDDLFYRVLSDLTGTMISDQATLMSYISRVSKHANEFEKMSSAIAQMQQTGYGVVAPVFESFELEEPTLHRSGKNFGVKLRATGKSLHIISVDVKSEVAPIIGDQAQSEEMLKLLKQEFADNKHNLWETPIFGRTLESIVREDIDQKSNSMPTTARTKMQKTITRIINHGKGGVICILM